MKGELKGRLKEIAANLREDDNEIFHRTRYLNRLLHICTAPVVGIWDTDAILSKSQIEESLNAILAEGYVSWECRINECNQKKGFDN